MTVSTDGIEQIVSPPEAMEVTGTTKPEEFELSSTAEHHSRGGEEFHSAASALSTWRFFIIVGCLNLGLFLSLMDLSIISTAIYTISIEFSDYQRTIWAALAYLLGEVGCAVFVTRLADVYGRKQIVLASFFFFTCFSLACGLSQTVEQLIIFRALQGIGGTGLYSLTMVICPEISPPKYLYLVVGGLGVTVATAAVCGPVLGGVIAGTTTWRWIFWLNVPIGVVTTIVLFFAWPSAQNLTETAEHPKLKQIDFFGTILMAVGSICFVLCLEKVGIRDFRWSSPAAVCLLALAGTAWVVFFAWQWYISRGKIAQWILPQLPWRIMTQRPMAMAILSTLMTGFVQFAAIFSIPIRAQIVDLNTPIRAGLRLLPLVAVGAFGALVGGAASKGKNVTFWTMSVGTALMVVGSGLLTTLPTNGTETKLQYVWEAILGFGLGMTVSTATFMTSMEVEFQDHAVAQGTVALARLLGGTIGIVTSTVVMNNNIEAALEGSVTPAVLKSLYVFPFTVLEDGIEVALKFRASYITSFKQDSYIGLYVSAAAFVCSLCIYQRNPPTVKQRSEELAAAVAAYQQSKSAVVELTSV